MIMVTYQKANGQIIQRVRNTLCPYRVGDKTSMGWTVLEILYNYKGKYYTKNVYDKFINEYTFKYQRELKIKSTIYKIYKELIYPVALLIMIRLLEVLTK